MKLYLGERPSVLVPSRAQVPALLLSAHPVLVGRWAVAGAQLMQQQSVQLQEAKARIKRTDGFTAQSGNAASPVGAGADASGVPPRGRPV